ncbi:MAG TPA: HEAT repeat domain-containing protein, partial [Caldilineaceae bacterium]|nr:HEAT repeat domain-containing protein [Caldilineaceae bacterium]
QTNGFPLFLPRLRMPGGRQPDQPQQNQSNPVSDPDSAQSVSLTNMRTDQAIADVATSTPKVFTAQESRVLTQKLQWLFSEAAEETFADGMESNLSRGLQILLADYGEMAMNQIILLEEQGKIAAEVLAEILRTLGNIDNDTAYSRRRWFLEHALQHPSTQVRDGAILGLSFLEDPRIIPALGAALRCETHDTLRADIQQVIADLQAMLP